MAKRKEDGWVSVVEAAKRLGVSSWAVYKAVEDGRLKARKIAVTRKVLRFDPQSIADFEVSKSHQKRGRQSARARRRNEQ